MKPRTPAWKPADYTPADIEAVQALGRGEASADQQKRVLDWLINAVSAVDDEPYRSDADGGERETAYALGRRSVGRELRKLATMPPALKDEIRRKHAERHGRG